MPHHTGPMNAATPAINADRLRAALAAVETSTLLRDELIALGLSPAIVAAGLREHIRHLEQTVRQEAES